VQGDAMAEARKVTDHEGVADGEVSRFFKFVER
jgi:hypothetical protein